MFCFNAVFELKVSRRDSISSKECYEINVGPNLNNFNRFLINSIKPGTFKLLHSLYVIEESSDKYLAPTGARTSDFCSIDIR